MSHNALNVSMDAILATRTRRIRNVHPEEAGATVQYRLTWQTRTGAMLEDMKVCVGPSHTNALPAAFFVGLYTPAMRWSWLIGNARQLVVCLSVSPRTEGRALASLVMPLLIC